MQKNEFKLVSPFSPTGDQPKAIEQLTANLKNNQRYQTLLGVTGSGKTFTIANVIKNIGKATLIMSHNKTLAAQLYGELKTFFPENAVEYFISYYDYYQPEAYLPTSDIYIEKTTAINEKIEKFRLKATASLVSRNDVIIVASVSCIYGLGSPNDYRELALVLKEGETIKRNDFFNSLVDMQYTRNKYELGSGSFRVKGDIIDIHPAYEDTGVRLSMFGDEIEKIEIINFLTGEHIDVLKEIEVFPAKHFVVTRPKIKKAILEIEKELEQRVDYFKVRDKLLEAQRIEQRTRMDLEFLKEMGVCSGIENYSRHLGGRKEGERPYTLIDFLPEDFLLIIDESHVSVPQIRAMYAGDRARKMNLVDFGFRLPSALDNRPLKFQEFENIKKQTIFLSATPSNYELEKSGGEIVEQVIRPTGIPDPQIFIKPVKNQTDDLINEIDIVVKRKERVLVTTLTKRMSEDLTTYLVENGVKARYLHSEIPSLERVQILNDLRIGEFDVLVGINLLREGLDLPEVSLVAILDADREGFLRDKRSLLQTSGRAARNINSKVIFYAERITDSMKNTIDEVNRRRVIQLEYNKVNNIVPKTIYKSNDGILGSSTLEEESKAAETIMKYNDKNSHEKLIKELTKNMKNAASELNFELAAELRDKLKRL